MISKIIKSKSAYKSKSMIQKGFGKRRLSKKNKGKIPKENKLQKIWVIIHNINYYDKDGNVIVDNKSFSNTNKDYKYEQGASGAYGFYHEYNVPSGKIQNFESDIKSYYKSLGIKNIKIIVSKNKNEINSKLYLLDVKK